MRDICMIDTGEVRVEGIDEQIRRLKEASTKNPAVQKRINEVVDELLRRVRHALMQSSRSGLGMDSDPRSAYKAIRRVVYRKIFGGELNILSSRKAHGLQYYEPPRHPSHIGGNRMKQSERTHTIMSYQGMDRGFILRFLNQGTRVRYALYGRNETRHESYDAFQLRIGGKGHRKKIEGKNWFGPASQMELQNAAANIDKMLDEIIKDILE